MNDIFKDGIVLVDMNNMLYRFYYGYPKLTTRKGEEVGCVYGVATFIMKTLIKQKPRKVFFVKDSPKKNFRHVLYDKYKQQRQKMPESIISQSILIEEMLHKMNIPIVWRENYEADDVIASMAWYFIRQWFFPVYILSNDKDLYAIVCENIRIVDPLKQKIIWEREVKQMFWVSPESIPDYLAFVGDSSDNIPGVQGIGPKKAQKILNHYRDIESFLKDIENTTLVSEKEKHMIQQQKEMLFLSKQLASLQKDLVLEEHIYHTFFDKTSIYGQDVREFFKKLEFYSFLPWNHTIDVFQNTKAKEEYSDIQEIIIINDTKAKEKVFHLLQIHTHIYFHAIISPSFSKEGKVYGILLSFWKEMYYLPFESNLFSKSDITILFKYLFSSNTCLVWCDLHFQISYLKLYFSNIFLNETETKQLSFDFSDSWQEKHF